MAHFAHPRVAIMAARSRLGRPCRKGGHTKHLIGGASLGRAGGLSSDRVTGRRRLRDP